MPLEPANTELIVAPTDAAVVMVLDAALAPVSVIVLFVTL
jgi:hypothetical protein